ncbi:MAG: phosphohydrolase [Clostridiaceae bacterium]|nr:phosphohydrolase [Clostridiaceae bacterium]
MLLTYASDILHSEGMQSEKNYRQHRDVSCYEHSIAGALMSVRLASFLRIKLNMRSLVRGALLHDYFLYDWHDADKSHRFHGFIHARRALRNAERDFTLTAIERDIIVKHMFPLNPRPPRFRESLIVIVADRICAFREILSPAVTRIKKTEKMSNDAN